jgi:hypothetical protein
MNHELVIEAGRTEGQYWRDLFRYRELFYFLAWRDLLVRYKQTVIGILWAGAATLSDDGRVCVHLFKDREIARWRAAISGDGFRWGVAMAAFLDVSLGRKQFACGCDLDHKVKTLK